MQDSQKEAFWAKRQQLGQEINRAEQCRDLLESHPGLLDFFNEYEALRIKEWRRGATVEVREEAYRDLKAMDKLRQYLSYYSQRGPLAIQEIKKIDSILDKEK